MPRDGGGVEPDDQAEDVEERQAAHHDVVGRHLLDDLGRAQRVEVDVGVRQLGTLGPAGRAGGVEDDRGVVVGALVRVGDRLAALEGAGHRAHRAALDDLRAAVGAPLVASSTKSGQTKAILAPESVKK
jgi:hypothetical protein